VTRRARPIGFAGLSNINTVDVIAVQFLTELLSGCKLTAADVNGDSEFTTQDVICRATILQWPDRDRQCWKVPVPPVKTWLY